jgi:hypothetical protein
MDNGGGRRPRRPRRPRGNYADQAGNGEQGDQPQSASPENLGEAHNAPNNGGEAGAKPAEEARPASEPVASEPTPVVGEPVTADANN